MSYRLFILTQLAVRSVLVTYQVRFNYSIPWVIYVIPLYLLTYFGS
jgi:hypothetical protein